MYTCKLIIKVLGSKKKPNNFFLRSAASCSQSVMVILCITGGRGSVVGIATRYEVKRPGTHSRWGRHFPLRSRPALGPIHRPVDYREDRVSFQEVKRTERGAKHPPTSSAKIKDNRAVPLFPCLASWPVLG